jgi:uncharacterized membrane protein (DUF373 family)
VAERSPSPPPTPPSSAKGRRRSSRATRWLEGAESAIYLLVGGCFLAAAVLSLIYGIVSFAGSVATLLEAGLIARGNGSAGAGAIISLVSDLLLTLIILEVMSTVVRYLQLRATSLKPFLIIGIISATRSVLAVGARLSVSTVQQLNIEEFRGAMIELVVNATVIVALGVTLRLIGSFADDRLDGAPTEQPDS